ncbi:MAG: arylsulfatase [Pirellulaceae bacterium]|nr:arylsulfatase [Pirellulaceae bacterium]
MAPVQNSRHVAAACSRHDRTPDAAGQQCFRLWTFATLILSAAALLIGGVVPLPVGAAEGRPNLVVIMADDLGYGDLGCYGQQLIQTPRLDRMAREGLRFRQFYAGCPVCAPSRSVLMTGQHMGHTHVRGNAGGDMSIQSLRDEDRTVAEVLQQAGYATALCGKWGLGDQLPGAEAGLPLRQGFDFFYGYLNQVHAHNYYPEFLWRNTRKEPLRNQVQSTGGGYGGFDGGYATRRVDYSHDLVLEQALQFVREHRSQPFFLYLALTIPHANNEGTRATGNGQEVPDFGPYAERDWSDQDKGQAAMITRMDAGIGRLLDLLAQLDIDQRTVVLFTSDNGPHDEGGHDTQRFQPSGPLRGMKRDLYEGGIRVPLIVRCPGHTPAGQITDHVAYFGDLLATAAELAGATTPPGLDSLSFLPAITGRQDQQRRHDHLYWEFYERGGKQAVRQGDWKAIRMPMFTGRTELYDLSRDLGEARDVAGEHPEVVQRLESLMDAAHTPHPNWQPKGSPEKQQPAPGDGKPRF